MRTLRKAGKLHLLIKELEANDLDIAGLSQIRWQGEGHFQSGDSSVIFSGGIRGQGGVAVILNNVEARSATTQFLNGAWS